MIHRFSLLFLFVLIVIGLFACDFQRVDTSKMANEIRSRQIKHVSPSQVLALANDFGQKIKADLNKDLYKSLSNPAFVDSLAKANLVTISLLQLSDTNSTKILPKIKELLDAYAYNASQKLPQEDNLQKLDGGTRVVFTSPIVLESPFKKIKGKKMDSFYDRKSGDFLGVWTIVLERKNIVNKIDIKAFGRVKVKR